jgi:hypothetical protein
MTSCCLLVLCDHPRHHHHDSDHDDGGVRNEATVTKLQHEKKKKGQKIHVGKLHTLFLCSFYVCCQFPPTSVQSSKTLLASGSPADLAASFI